MLAISGLLVYILNAVYLFFLACLTSNHILFQYVTDIGGLFLKGGSPAGGILDPSRLYAYILEWKLGSSTCLFPSGRREEK